MNRLGLMILRLLELMLILRGIMLLLLLLALLRICLMLLILVLMLRCLWLPYWGRIDRGRCHGIRRMRWHSIRSIVSEYDHSLLITVTALLKSLSNSGLRIRPHRIVIGMLRMFHPPKVRRILRVQCAG